MTALESLPLLIAGSEWLIVVIVVGILILGASKIPQLARSIGRASAEYETAKKDAERELKFRQQEIL